MNINQYAVYQLKDSAELAAYRSRSYQYLTEHHFQVIVQNYQQAYFTKLFTSDTPEMIRKRLEEHRPKNFRGRPFGVGDVIVINQQGEITAYFVDKDSLVVVAGFIRNSSSGILVTLDTKNLFIDGCAGTWMATEECVVESQHFFLMQHEVYKEKAPNVIVDASGKLVSAEIRKGLDVQGVQTPQVQMAKKKRSRTKNKWQDSTIRSILKNPLYIGKCTLTLAKAKRELEVPAIVSKTEFQKAQKKLESTRLPSRKKARKKPNLLFKKIYDKESGKGLLCRTSEDESQQIYSFDKGYRCFSGKAPFIESEKIFREILSALEKEKMQAAHIDRVLDLNPEKVKQCMDAGLLQYRKRANEIVAHLMAKDDERTAVYRQYEQGSILLEQVEEYEHQYQVAVQKQEAAFKKVMLAVNDIEKAFSHGNPWLMKFRAISIPEKLERTHLKEWLDHVWIVDFEQVEVILQESEWKRFFPEEWLNNGEEDCNGKKE